MCIEDMKQGNREKMKSNSEGKTIRLIFGTSRATGTSRVDRKEGHVEGIE